MNSVQAPRTARDNGLPIEWRNGSAVLRGRSVEELAAEYGTPHYIYDSETLAGQYRKLCAALPQAVEVFYSVKANPHPAVIGCFVREGAGCEIASGGEYALARQAGAMPDTIVFAGPAKGREELDYVVSRGIGEIHLESFEEVEVLECLARQRNTTVKVSIRVNPSAALGGRLLMGGQPTAFGFEEEALQQVVQVISGCAHLRLQGVHLYTGTQILDADLLIAQWRHAIAIGRHFANLTGLPVPTIDLGGGLGIPYFAQDQELDLERLASGARSLIDSARTDAMLKDCRFIVESGRFLAGPAGIYTARVRSVKNCRGTMFVVLDGGMNHHLAASGNLGQVIRRDYPIINLSRNDFSDLATVVVAGPLCTPIDTLGRNVTLTRPRPGDLLGVLQSGAYGLSASPVGFLSHPTPAEILISKEGCEQITPRGVPFQSTIREDSPWSAS